MAGELFDRTGSETVSVIEQNHVNGRPDAHHQRQRVVALFGNMAIVELDEMVAGALGPVFKDEHRVEHLDPGR